MRGPAKWDLVPAMRRRAIVPAEAQATRIPRRRGAAHRRRWPILVVSFLLLCLTAGTIARATEGIRVAGDALQLLLPASAAGVSIAHRDGEGTLQLARSAAVTMGATFGLKYLIRERRPDGGSHSFPSGHTSISFCSAEFLDKRYGWKTALPAFVAATFVAYSRVESKEHYLHDVLAGAAIGVVGSELFTRSYGRGCFRATVGRDLWIGWSLRITDPPHLSARPPLPRATSHR